MSCLRVLSPMVAILGLLLGGCCINVYVTPCCAPPCKSCDAICSGSVSSPGVSEGKLPSGIGQKGFSLPSTPFKKATLRNAPGHGKKIVSAKVRGRDSIGIGAAFQFAPPPIDSYTENYYPIVPESMPLLDDGTERTWTAAPQAPPDPVRNVEMEIVIETVPGDPSSKRTYSLEITSTDPCTEPTSGQQNKLQYVVVTLLSVGAAPYNANFQVQRYYYNTDNQIGCGSGSQCTLVTGTCNVAAQP